jgi:16S rRNA (guanine527-N7)-methyltransferase
MEDIQKKYSLLYDLNISRETCIDFESLITMIQDKNQEINIVSKETAKDSVIRERHIIDSAQIYDLIDLNHNTTIDLGTGGGMPGIVVAIIMKNLKKI